jgi:hypothetical protein
VYSGRGRGGGHTTTQSHCQVKGASCQNVLIDERVVVFQLLATKDKSLLPWWGPFSVLDLSLDVLNRAEAVYSKRDRPPAQCHDTDLHGLVDM